MGASTKNTVTTKLLSTVQDLRQWHASIAYLKSAVSHLPVLGFVPTMGALHEGHLQLIRQARAGCRHVVVSIFVNPLQFAPHEDLDKYPRMFQEDVRLCRQEGVDVIFHPNVEEMYPGGQSDTTRVIPPSVLERSLLGEYRPVFFSGVATVVARLFNIVQPDIAYFGEKDYQQLLVIRRMVADLKMPITISAVPTVRQRDGLAFSSRNALLSAKDRKAAPEIYKVLCSIRDNVVSGDCQLRDAIQRGSVELNRLPNVSLKYLVAVDPDSLEVMDKAKIPMVLLVAAKFSDVWLIDTLTVQHS